jgi:hypothetical protein
VKLIERAVCGFFAEFNLLVKEDSIRHLGISLGGPERSVGRTDHVEKDKKVAMNLLHINRGSRTICSFELVGGTGGVA